MKKKTEKELRKQTFISILFILLAAPPKFIKGNSMMNKRRLLYAQKRFAAAERIE